VQNACVTDPTLAPPGMSTLYMLIAVTHQHANVDWARERPAFRELAVRQLARIGLADVEKRIRFERVITPADWDSAFEIHQGSTFNLAHNLRQMLHLRPRNRFEDLESAYLVVFDARTRPGGKADVLEADGYRFDMGPTILLMPSVLTRISEEAGRDLGERLELVRLDPQWRSFFDDGTVRDLHADIAAMDRNLAAFAPGQGIEERYRRFLGLAQRLHKIANDYFFWRSVGSPREMLSAKAIDAKLLADVLQARPWQTLAQAVRSHMPDRRVAQMLDHFTQYVGSCPASSPAVLCGIAHMQTSEGLWYPRGGTRAIPEALFNLALELGVEFHLRTGVKSILLDHMGGVEGVETSSGDRVALAAVVSNADSVRTHCELLSGTRAAARFEARRRYEPACSGVVLYLGLERRYDHLLHHNFVFSRDPHAEFHAIYHEGQPAADPTCYVCAPARTELEVAPDTGEALYVLVHTPYLRDGHNWSEIFPRYRRIILEELERTAGLENIEKSIRFESWLTPRDIHDRYRVLNGAIYGLASHGRLSGMFKPSNRSPDVKRLYLAGGAAHPGPGMPLVIMSGWIAADALDRDRMGSRPGGHGPSGSEPAGSYAQPAEAHRAASPR
jgi:phytoene desaturase